MSRTGTEFVDIRSHHWDINHWVRGACLYGVMPANGLLYAPRHPCACYLEAKLSGFNALAPEATSRRFADALADTDRLDRGPAYAAASPAEPVPRTENWPTFRHDSGRTGRTSTAVRPPLSLTWSTALAGKLTSPVIAGGRLFVASVEDHTLHVLDAASGEPLWQFQASGRIDSPPTIYRGLVLFGSADGHVYCLRAADGALAWRLLAAPLNEQLVSFGQLESVWPVHGSVLVENDVLYFIAGRSMFVDGGMLLWRLNPVTGRVLSKTTLDEVDTRGKQLQDYVSWLNMPPALPDILSSNGKYIYMRSQPFQLDGTRLPLQAMPKKPDADRGAPDPQQVAEHAHIFSPTGFLDDTWWHRTYWLYGSTFISGWSGYYLSGRVAPAGRLLVTDDTSVYGFGRQPKYFRWTTPIEHQLFRANKDLQLLPSPPRKGSKETRVAVAKSPSLNPSDKPLTVATWIKADRPNGVILARGGDSAGYCLYLEKGRPVFAIRSSGKLTRAQAKTRTVGKWVHLAGVLTEQTVLQLYVDGELAAEQRAGKLIASNPAEGMEIGADEATNVGAYPDRCPFSGLIDNVRVFYRQLDATEIKKAATGGAGPLPEDPTLVLAYTFDEGTAADLSGKGNTGTIDGPTAEAGRVGKALRFVGGVPVADFRVVHHWTKELPLFVRAMVLASGTLFVAGPPDLINEDDSFRRIADRQVQQRLRAQAAAVEGKSGAVLRAVSAADGQNLAEYPLETPPVFDGMVAANGRLYIATVDGHVLCLQ